MRKVFLDDLPRQGKSKRIHWKNSVGNKINFIYDDIEGELLILDYIIENGRNYIITEYENNKNFRLWIGDIPKCKLGYLLGRYNIDYIYSIGQIIENGKNGKLKILKQAKLKVGNRNLKSYNYECMLCGDKNEKTEDELKRNGCAVCAGNKILKGYNDLWTVRPEIAKLLKYPERGYLIGLGTGVNEEMFICPDCNYEKSQILNNAVKQGFSCIRCGDGVSYPEKVLTNLLMQLNVKFKKEISFNWSKDIKFYNENLSGKKRYDFYIPSLNCIIETHGEQHYRHCGFTRTLNEEQENDKLKEKLALNNGIENYIVIDCQKSEIGYIKDNIIASKLNNIFDLTKINWEECNMFALNSNVKLASLLWDRGKTIKEISDILKVHIETVRTYLKRGFEIGFCNYDSIKLSKDRYIQLAEANKRKIIQLSLEYKFIKEWDSVTDARNSLNVSDATILAVLKRRTKTATGYIWMYKEDYELNKESLDNKEAVKIGNKREIIQVSLNGEYIKTWSSISEANKSLGKIGSNIHLNCKGKTKSAYNFKWMYKEDYDKYIEESYQISEITK